MAIVSPGEVISDAAWVNVSAFTNSWANFGSGRVPARYRKDGSGFVHLQGTIVGGADVTIPFTLPAGYRPAYSIAVTGPSVTGSSWSANAIFLMDTNGDFYVIARGGTAFSSFSLTFFAEN